MIGTQYLNIQQYISKYEIKNYFILKCMIIDFSGVFLFVLCEYKFL